MSIQKAADPFSPIALSNVDRNAVPQFAKVYQEISGVKKGYKGLNVLLSLIANATSSLERQNQAMNSQKLLKQHVAPLAVSDFLIKLSRLKSEYSTLVQSKTREERITQLKKSTISTLGLSSYSVQLMKFFQQAGLTDLTLYVKQLKYLGNCSALVDLYTTGIDAVNAFTIWKNYKAPLPTEVPPAVYKKTPWTRTNLTVEALYLSSSILSAMNLFCAVAVSPHLCLALAVTTFSAEIATKMFDKFQQIGCERRASSL